jgi:hypothetical protein
VLGPLFGDAYKQAQNANSKEEFAKSKEAASAAAAWGSSLGGSALQAYGVGALINATGTLSQKGAAYLGALIFFASSAPTVSLTLDSSVCIFDKYQKTPATRAVGMEYL